MKSRAHRTEGMPALQLVEEAVQLLRRAPGALLFQYYLGAIPFVLTLLYFWADMSRGLYAEERLPGGALLLVVAFIWMKCWQSLFSAGLRATIGDQRTKPWSAGRMLRMAVFHASVSTTGFFVLPIALVITLPFGYAYAFYQSFTVLTDGTESSLREQFRRAFQQAHLWPGQNHLVLLTMLFFSFVVYLNCLTGLMVIPGLLKMLVGWETVFSRTGSAFVMNTTYQMVICALTWLCVSPLTRAIYTLRAFYGESLATGEDIRAELHGWRRIRERVAVFALAIFSLLVISGSAQAAESSKGKAAGVSGSQLNQQIDKVLKRPEFTWRSPRERVLQGDEKGWLVRMMNWIVDSTIAVLKSMRDVVKAVVEWLIRIFRPGFKNNPSGNSGTGWQDTLRAMVFVLLTVAAVALALLLMRFWKQRPTNMAEAVPVTPDLNADDVTADQLPEDEWMKLAYEMLDKGDARLALRALYLACIAHLGNRELVSISRAKSNRDYLRELSRRARSVPELIAAFGDNVSVFDRVWYGMHEVTRGMFDQFRGNLERIRVC